MASKTSFFGFAFFLSFTLLFSTLVTTTCAGSYLPEFQSPPLPNPDLNPHPILPPLTPTHPTSDEKCPRDALKIGLCAKVLNIDLLKVILGKPPVTPCCSLIQGLADLEVGVCLCTAIKASVLGIDLPNIPISLDLLLNNCGKNVPSGFECA